MESNEQIIEKIKKLLRMKRGGSAAEVETALSLAQQLALKHNIDINSVDPDAPQRERITHETVVKLSRLQFEVKYTALILNNFFNVQAFHDVYGLTFIGTRTDIEIARYVYNFLVNHFRREWKIKKGRLRNRQVFMWGMYQGICWKLNSLKPASDQKEGIILISHAVALKNYMNENFDNLKDTSVKPDSDAQAALRAGRVAGMHTNIHKAVNGNEQQKLLEG